MDIYAKLIVAGCETDSHESDLYVRADETAVRVILEHETATGQLVHSKRFISQIDGKLWLDIPFAFTPYWTVKAKRAGSTSW